MNKVFNINLGGFPFTIDANAYEHLSIYLKTIHNHFRQSEGYEEITSDIETRLAEIFRENLGDRPILTLRHVEDAIAIMGTPEDFGAEPIESDESEEPIGEPSSNSDPKEGSADSGYRTGKRLFRNPEDEKLGGVCSGIAAYFGIEDPLWIRIAFIVFTISGGFGILLYIILWAVLPKADSASDRLSMRGEPINVSNIGKIIEEEMGNFSKKMADLGDDWGESWGASTTKKKRTESEGQIRKGLESAVSGLGKAIGTLFRIIGQIWKPVLFILLIAVLIAFAASWIGAIIGLTFAYPYMGFFMPGATFLPMMLVFGLMIAIGLPILSIALGISKRLFGFRLSPYTKAGFTGIWILGIISLAFSASKTAREFQTEHEIVINEESLPVLGDTLYLELDGPNYHENFSLFGHEVSLRENKLISKMVVLNIFHNDDPGFNLKTTHFSRGNSTDECKALAERIDYRYFMEGSRLHFNRNFEIEAGSKWRGQKVILDLYIPEGKIVVFKDKDLQNLRHHIDIDRDQEHPWNLSDCNYWVMGPEGLYCPDYLKSLSVTKTWDGKDYSRIHIDGNFNLQLSQGETYSLKIQGDERDLEKITIRQLDNLVDIFVSESLRSTAKIEVQLPSLELIEADGLKLVDIYGVEGADLELWLDNVKKAKAFVKVDKLKLRQSRDSNLDLRGEADILEARLERSSELVGRTFQVREATLELTGRSEVELQVSEIVRERKSDGSSIQIDGGAERISLDKED